MGKTVKRKIKLVFVLRFNGNRRKQYLKIITEYIDENFAASPIPAILLLPSFPIIIWSITLKDDCKRDCNVTGSAIVITLRAILAVAILEEMKHGDYDRASVLLKTSLVKRSSTAPPCR